ncbi:MAG: pentapeptide repeat-containing protein [Desulfobulbaceae bacterium]|nr:pentapeptide repeat-containing protein [Desulfobulbaceae bacterium]
MVSADIINRLREIITKVKAGILNLVHLCLRTILFLWPPIFLYFVVNNYDLIRWQEISRQVWFLGALCYSGYLMILALWKIPVWQTSNLHKCCTPKEIGELRDSYRKTIAQVAGGTALLAGLYFTWSNLITVQQGQITDRFTRAVEQLGAEDTAIRLGGIYALERIARDSRADQGPVIEILTAYVRNNAPQQSNNKNLVKDAIKKIQPELHMKAKLREDIQAILTVIGRREFQIDERPLDLRETDLSSANLVAADLRMANFTEANLSFVDFKRANLSNAQFWDTVLYGATLRGANLREAMFGGTELLRVDFRMANLQGALFENVQADEVQFWGASLDGATLSNVDLSKAIGLSLKQLTSTRKYGKVILPDYLKQ